MEVIDQIQQRMEVQQEHKEAVKKKESSKKRDVKAASKKEAK
jgi:hypothetical protein